MWNTLRAQGLELEPAVSLKSNVYLGCAQREVEVDMDLVFAKREMMNRLCDNTSCSGNPVSTNIPELKEPSDEPAPKPKRNKKKAGQTPNSFDSTSSFEVAHAKPSCTGKPVVEAWSYEMFGHVTQTVDRYLELSGKARESLRNKAATPCIDDHLIPPEEFEEKGHLSAQAARIVLKALYVARVTRWDFLWTVICWLGRLLDGLLHAIEGYIVWYVICIRPTNMRKSIG